MLRLSGEGESQGLSEEELERAREYWLKRHKEAAIALGVSATRLIELGVEPPSPTPAKPR